jgi:hypothetical protein
LLHSTQRLFGRGGLTLCVSLWVGMCPERGFAARCAGPQAAQCR